MSKVFELEKVVCVVDLVVANVDALVNNDAVEVVIWTFGNETVVQNTANVVAVAVTVKTVDTAVGSVKIFVEETSYELVAVTVPSALAETFLSLPLPFPVHR